MIGKLEAWRLKELENDFIAKQLKLVAVSVEALCGPVHDGYRVETLMVPHDFAFNLADGLFKANLSLLQLRDRLEAENKRLRIENFKLKEAKA